MICAVLRCMMHVCLRRREGSSRAASSIAAASLQQSLSESLSESDGEVESLIKQHVAGAHLLSRGASEIVFRLPKEDSSRRDPKIALFSDHTIATDYPLQLYIEQPVCQIVWCEKVLEHTLQQSQSNNVSLSPFCVAANGS